MTRLPRRCFLRGGAGALIALPWLDAMPTARAASAPRRRFVGFFTTNGTVPEHFWPLPAGTAAPPLTAAPRPHYTTGIDAQELSDFVLPYTLEPLAPHRKDLLTVEGLDRVDNGHGNYGSILTGWPILGKGEVGVGTSVDQELARHLGKETRLPSLQLGVQVGEQGRTLGNVSWYDTGRPAPAENLPHVVFAKLFGGVTMDAALAEALRREQRSVLDAARAQIHELQQRLGAADRSTLEHHLESLRAIEKQLGELPASGQCGAPTAAEASLLAGKRPGERGMHAQATVKLQLDLLAAALACDQTRVVTLQIGNEACNMPHPWLGVTTGFHNLSHSADSNLTAMKQIADINRWYMSQLAYLVGRLKATPDREGRSVFDNTLVFWSVGLTKGNLHTARNMPILMLGSAGGALRTGRAVRIGRDRSTYRPNMFQPPTGRCHGDLLVTLLHAFGIPAATFGDPKKFKAPLDAELLAP